MKHHHLFASSAVIWRVDEDIAGLIDKMRKDGYDFDLYYLPVPRDAEYEIENYTPQDGHQP